MYGKAVFLGLARDVEGPLPYVIENIECMRRIFSSSTVTVYENDSADRTKHILDRWANRSAHVHVRHFDGMAHSHPVRTVRLATLRNKFLDLVRRDPNEADFVIILDLDEVNAQPLEPAQVSRALDFLKREDKRAACFANQVPIHYDIWSLRHPTLCPGDAWEEVHDYAAEHGVSDDIAFRETFAKRIPELSPESAPLRVDSGFGGLAIYKAKYFIAGEREYCGYRIKIVADERGSSVRKGWQTCEHVSFHLGLGDVGGELYIAPHLINARIKRFDFSPAEYRNFLFDLTDK